MKIRDLSTGGALIEGGVLPLLGTKVKLVRGDLTIAGQVVWSRGARAGLQFDAQAIVADWLPNARPLSPQARVDAIVHEFNTAPPKTPIGPTEPRPRRVDAEELLRVKALLEALAEDLVEDVDVLARHGSKLQTLDLAAQVLGKLAMQIR